MLLIKLILFVNVVFSGKATQPTPTNQQPTLNARNSAQGKQKKVPKEDHQLKVMRCLACDRSSHMVGR